jgi:Lon protease-like protein
VNLPATRIDPEPVEGSMTHDEAVPSSFDGCARLFPLGNVVLFPQGMLPLHIFEPRYRQMTADALASDSLITMVLLKEGSEAEFTERPALHSIACLGKIIADQRLKDGRYNILLRGLSRVRILSELDTGKLYRSARVELLEDTAVPSSEQAHVYEDVLSPLVVKWLATLGVASEQLASLFQEELSLGSLLDILGFALPLAVEFKQELLEELDVERRARCLQHYLQTKEPPKGAASVRKFPPEFSTN